MWEVAYSPWASRRCISKDIHDSLSSEWGVRRALKLKSFSGSLKQQRVFVRVYAHVCVHMCACLCACVHMCVCTYVCVWCWGNRVVSRGWAYDCWPLSGEKFAMCEQESGRHLVWLQECTALTGESSITVHDSTHNTSRTDIFSPVGFVSLGAGRHLS